MGAPNRWWEGASRGSGKGWDRVEEAREQAPGSNKTTIFSSTTGPHSVTYPAVTRCRRKLWEPCVTPSDSC